MLLFGSPLAAAQPPDFGDEPPEPEQHRLHLPDVESDPRLPNGKSQKDAIAEQQHNDALKAANELADLAQQLKGDLQKAGNFVVPVSTIRKTEEIEKLARKIRGKLKS